MDVAIGRQPVTLVAGAADAAYLLPADIRLLGPIPPQPIRPELFPNRYTMQRDDRRFNAGQRANQIFPAGKGMSQ